MKRLLLALGWLIALEAVWASLLFIAAMFLVDRNWLAENFLDPVYLRQAAVESYRNDMIAALLHAAAATFLIGVVAGIVWHGFAALCRIYGPGEAARLLWLWLLILFVGALLSLGAVYLKVVLDLNNLVPDAAMYPVYGAAIVLFVLSYYIGTAFPTPPKLRPAVPLARFLPA